MFERPRRLVSWLVPLCATALAAQTPTTRTVTDHRLVSGADPRATFVIDTAYRFVGGQTIDILKVAGAEQFFFVRSGPDRTVRSFYWLQFEHYYPANTYTYDYSGIDQQALSLGPLAFVGDIRTLPNYFTMDKRPGSDSEAAATFLRDRGLSLSGTFVTLRLFHLPDASKRRELMIIYGERVTDERSSDNVKGALVQHAEAGITVQ